MLRAIIWEEFMFILYEIVMSGEEDVICYVFCADTDEREEPWRIFDWLGDSISSKLNMFGML
jgi:hypothetical protein